MTVRRHVLVGLIAVSLLFCIAVGIVFIRKWSETPPSATGCYDRRGHVFSLGDQELSRCLADNAQLFLDKDYAETKDLVKAFLTLLTAVLVASITFSEKIVDLSRAGWWSRGAMISCWVLILAAIASSGAGLAFMSMAAGWAAYRPDVDYTVFELRAVALFVTAGLSFGGALVALFVAGVISLVDQRS
jgi:hypothetical protein